MQLGHNVSEVRFKIVQIGRPLCGTRLRNAPTGLVHMLSILRKA